jgi:hypothetical protein
MVKKSHFFDIDTLIRIDSQVWIVSKMNPSIPLIKLTQSEFNLIKKGIYRRHDSPLTLAGVNYWLPKNLLEELKIKSKNSKIDITDLVFSMQEFMNSSVIENLDYKILVNHFQHLKNKTDDIYVICSKNNKKNYEVIISKLEKELEKMGLIIKNYYYLSETFYNRDTDYISHRKVRLLLQHLVGYKTDDDKFTDSEITKYDRIYFYDDEPNAISLALDINDILHFLIKKTDDIISSNIRDTIKRTEHVLVVNRITNNRINPIDSKEVVIEISNIIKTFEGFKQKKITR